MKKIIVAVLSSLVFLVACSSTSDQDGKKNTEAITVWAWDPNFNIAALELAKAAYEKKGGEIHLEIIENAQDDIVQKLNTTLSSGTTKGLPNIVLIEDYRAQSFLQAFTESFFPLTDSFQPKDFAEYKLPPTSLNGIHYGLPFDTGVTGLYVRTDYLAEAGYTVDDMKNISWSDYIEIGKKVKEVTGKHFLSVDPSDLGIVRIMIQSAGSWYTKDDGTSPNLEGNEALKEALQVYKDMLDFEIAKFHTDWSQFLAGFNSGDVATIPTGNWITPSVKAEESQSGNWAVVPIPKLDLGGSVNASNLGGSSWYVLDIPGKEKAAEFLEKTFGSNIDFYQELLTKVGAIGTYSPAADGKAYLTKDKFFQEQMIFSDFATWMEEVPSTNYGMHTYSIDDIIVVEMQNYINGKDIDDVLKDAQAQAESQIK